MESLHLNKRNIGNECKFLNSETDDPHSPQDCSRGTVLTCLTQAGSPHHFDWLGLISEAAS